MRPLSSVIAGAALVAMPATMGMAAPKSPKLARCDGHSRRPANPYGTILPTVDAAAGTVTPTAPSSVDVFPSSPPAGRTPRDPAAAPRRDDPSPPQVPPIGALALPTLYRSC